MKNHVIEALKKSGWTQDQINKLIAQNALDTPTEDLNTIAAEVMAAQKAVIENEITPTIRKNETGKVRDIVEKILIKEAGWTDDQVKEFFPEEKDRYPKMVARFAQDLRTSKDKTANELQQELATTKAELKKVREEEIPGIQSAADKRIEDYETNAEISKIYGTAAEYRDIPMSVVTVALDNALRTKYDIKRDANKKVQFYEKGTDKLAMNADKTKILTPEEIVKSEATELKLVKESNGGSGKTETIIVPEEKNQPKIVSAHLDTATAHEQSLKK